MDQIVQYLEPIFRWYHIFFGILWIGILYWFNFVNIPFAGTMDGDTKRKVIPELLPRALFWFRWGAAYTWILGILLLGLVYEYQSVAVGTASQWTGGNHGLFWSFLLAPFIYDFIAKSIKDPKMMAGVGYVLIFAVVFLMQSAGFAYRGYIMYMGAMFGSIMAYNVWFRIWPNQQKIITAIKNGTAPDAALAAQTGMRSKHNTYLSVPLVWAMINAHTSGYAGSWIYFPIVVLVGWFGTMQMFKRAGKVKGF
ncbi:MAG: urate hydroxylase PuuD [bacterium]